jgi:hypothetical protein
LCLIRYRKLKLTDSETKLVRKDLEIFKKSSSSRYNESDPLDNSSIINAKAAAEMDIEYPPNFEDYDTERPVKFIQSM